jgi:exonuclease VII small subunit
LHEVKGTFEGEEVSKTLENIMTLNTLETGYSVLTLEEAIQTFKDGEESKLFCLKLKQPKLKES